MEPAKNLISFGLLFAKKIIIMFGLFKKKSKREILLKQYSQLQEEAFHLSKTNRTASDAKTAEAEALMQRIESLPKEV